MRIAIVNPISETPTSFWSTPTVNSNHQSIAVQLGRAIERLGHSATVFMAEPYRPAIRDEGVECQYFPVSIPWLVPPSVAPLPRNLVHMLRDFDVVLASETFQPSTVAAALAVRRSGGRLIIWQELGGYQDFMKSIPARVYYRLIGRPVLSAADGYCVRAPAARSFLLQLGARPDLFGPMLPNAADENIFAFDPTVCRQQLIVCPGSLVEQKNPFIVLEAFVRYVADQIPDARLLFKGRGPLASALRTAIEASGLADRVSIDTERSTAEEMCALFQRARVGVVASTGKGASLSPVEMAMCGTPVVMCQTLYHAGMLSQLEAAVPVPASPESIGVALRTAFSVCLADGARAGVAAAVADAFGLDSATERFLDFLIRTESREA